MVAKDFSTQICAGSLDGSTDTCQGDSGGGLFVSEYFFNNDTSSYQKKILLAGVVSYGEGCATFGKPGKLLNSLSKNK